MISERIKLQAMAGYTYARYHDEQSRRGQARHEHWYVPSSWVGELHFGRRNGARLRLLWECLFLVTV